MSNQQTDSSAIAASAADTKMKSTPQRSGIVATAIGMLLAVGFYGLVYGLEWAPLQRYFLGHPVAIAATVLFWFAVAILATKWWVIKKQWALLDTIRDADLLPAHAIETPAERWRTQNDAGHVAKGWISSLNSLSKTAKQSQLIRRLLELLDRQAQRGNSKHLADDLRELSGRDADDAHDSLGLVRIIVWAIPMLGFLGTVIGITQTLGGLDFTNGAAAVDNLKGGLYVAFDTTALGLVLSVVAIFVQFPVERSEQRLLAAIDHRVGQLVSTGLPSGEAADNQTALITDLCEGIRAAVAESLAAQTNLWRETIDEAQSHWRNIQQANANQIAEALQTTLTPALKSHATVIAETAVTTSEKIHSQARIFQEAMVTSAGTLATHHQKMISQCDQMAGMGDQSRAILQLQRALDSNLERLDATNRGVQHSIESVGSDGMSDAVVILARAVDMLAKRLPDDNAQRRAA